MKFLGPEAIKRALELSKNSYRPPQIVKLKEDIEAGTKALELKVSASGQVSQEEINEIVRMKLELDRLYALWAEDKLDET